MSTWRPLTLTLLLYESGFLVLSCQRETFEANTDLHQPIVGEESHPIAWLFAHAKFQEALGCEARFGVGVEEAPEGREYGWRNCTASGRRWGWMRREDRWWWGMVWIEDSVQEKAQGIRVRCRGIRPFS